MKLVTPGDYIRSLESGLPSSERNKRWIVICQAYIDASGMGGIHREPQVVLGGFLATSEDWAKFSDAWKAGLNKPPCISYFKLNDAFSSIKNKKSQFFGWTENDVNAKIWTLIEIIKLFPLVRVWNYIDKDEFNQYTIKEADKRRIDNPYWLCFHDIIVQTVRDQIIHELNTPIDFIFDEEGALGYDCLSWYNYFKKSAFPKWVLPYLGSITFGNDKRIVALQAADLYAGLLRQHFYNNKIINVPKEAELRSIEKMSPEIGGPISLKANSMLMQLTNDDIRNITKKAREIGKRAREELEKRKWDWLTRL